MERATSLVAVLAMLSPPSVLRGSYYLCIFTVILLGLSIVPYNKNPSRQTVSLLSSICSPISRILGAHGAAYEATRDSNSTLRSREKGGGECKTEDAARTRGRENIDGLSKLQTANTARYRRAFPGPPNICIYTQVGKRATLRMKSVSRRTGQRRASIFVDHRAVYRWRWANQVTGSWWVFVALRLRGNFVHWTC